MKRFLKIIISLIVILLILVGIAYLIDQNKMENGEPVIFSTWGAKYAPIVQTTKNTKLNIVLSLEDEISSNSAWCGTFNLIWNDLKNDLAKQDIVFTPQLEKVKNLNKGTFNTAYLSEESYYKVCDRPSLELKAAIEKAIKDKFNETSDILDDFDWNNVSEEDYFLYAMLKKNFEFPNEFSELENDTFGKSENVKYFGINENTEEVVRDQVTVLYYNSSADFAVKLVTKGNDEVIISRGNNEKSFGEMYQKILERQKIYTGSRAFAKEDTLKIPNITFNLKEELTELENKPFLFSNGDEYYIEKALQTIQFELDKKGGKIKSEAGMMVENISSVANPQNPREFIVNDTFTIFLKEKNKDLPYFASQISDIKQVQ